MRQLFWATSDAFWWPYWKLCLLVLRIALLPCLQILLMPMLSTSSVGNKQQNKILTQFYSFFTSFFNLPLLHNCGRYFFMTLICTDVLKYDVKCHCLQWDTDSCLFELNWSVDFGVLFFATFGINCTKLFHFQF